MVIRSVEFLSGRRTIQRLYEQIQDEDFEPVLSFEKALEKLQISYQYDSSKLSKIDPGKGLVVIANHPFGVVDGLMIGKLVATVRDDFKILVNKVLCNQDERISPFLLPIDFDNTKEALQVNIATRKLALEHLAKNKCIIIFPGGGVSTSRHIIDKPVDLEWKKFVSQLVLKSNADLLPVFFHGRNSTLFQIASKISLNVRLGVLLYEVKNKMGKSFHVSIGDIIPNMELKTWKDRGKLLQFLKEKTMLLEHESIT
jgi:putative hemolysin